MGLPGEGRAWLSSRLLGALAFLVVWQPLVAAKKPVPVAVEAHFKERITLKLQEALHRATSHLAWALGASEPSSEGVFGPRYELSLKGSKWSSRCESDIDAQRDSPGHCGIHKLQALTALCEAGIPEESRESVRQLVNKLLVKREKVVPGLGIKRSMLPIGNGMEVWMSETSLGSGNFDVMVPLHAAATLAVVQCGSALQEPKLFETAQGWFAAIEKAWPQTAWPQASFHMNSILLESFVRMSTMIRGDSAFAEELRAFNKGFASYLHSSFTENPAAWSFSGAHATVLSWFHEKKKARRKQLSGDIAEYMRRWRQIAPALNVSTSYTCGPLQGVAPLLLKPGSDAADMVSSVLKLVEKDVDLFQINLQAVGEDGHPSLAASRLGRKAVKVFGEHLQGAFLRDEGQLKAEKRSTLRIDDTAQCVVALARTLELLDTLVGVEVADPEMSSGSAEAGEQVVAPPSEEL